MQLVDELRGRQVPLLLAYLVLNRSRHVGREELIDAVWPYTAPRSQDGALRTLLSRLRSALGADSLAGREELILRLPEPVWVDVEAAALEVQRAQESLGQGDARGAWALAQVPLNIAGRGLLPGAQASWLEPRRRDLEDIRLQALEVVGRAGLRIGGSQLASAERAARNLIDVEPYRESGYLLLMEALAGRGNVAEALRVFDRLRTLLRDELGTMPSPDMLALHQRLLRPESRPVPSALGVGQHHASAIELPAELRARGTMQIVGRRRELAELDRLWASAVGGVDPIAGASVDDSRAVDQSAPPVGMAPAGRIVLLTGDPGIGKTRLAAELARRVHDQGALVLAGRAPAETLVPYQPFLEALRQYVLGAPLGELRANAREYGPELARLVPELRRRLPDLPSPDQREPETERYRLFEAVVGLLTSLSAAQPILLVLDDLHWADRPTLLLLRHLARAADPARLLVLGAYRATETATDGFAAALADLRRERLVTRVEVEGLTERETEELVRLHTSENPSRPFTHALHEKTEGNPLFVEEIVRHLSEAGVHVGGAGASELTRFGLPEGVKRLIARRLERLDEPTLTLLRVAAVMGRDFDASVLERVVSLDEDDFLRALDQALGAGLVIESTTRPGHYSFSHALVRETLYEGMSGPRRARIHRRVGQALEASERPERKIAALAYHFTQAAEPGDAEKAITYARRAAAQATTMLAHEEAAAHYSRALEVLENFDPDGLDRRCELLLLLGEAQVSEGERTAGSASFREAAALAERLGYREGLARAAIGASRRYVQQPGVVEADLVAMLERALQLSAPNRTPMRVRLLSRLCGALYFTGDRDRIQALSDEATAIARDLNDPETTAYAHAARRRALWDPRELDARLAISTAMLTSARAAGNLELQMEAHAWLVVDLLEHGNLDGVDAQIETFTAGAERLRQPLYLWNLTVWRGMRALLAGRLEQANEHASEALAIGAPAEPVTAMHYYSAQMVSIRREQLRIAELEQPSREAADSYPVLHAWRAGLATVLLESGRIAEARRQLEILAEHDFEDIPPTGDWLTTIALISEVCATLSDKPRARLLYDKLLPFADSHVVVGLAAVCLGSTSRFLGKLAAAVGNQTLAVEHLERAVEANAALGAPVWLAHARLDLAELLADKRRASELVEAAAATAAELQLPWVARRVEQLR